MEMKSKKQLPFGMQTLDTITNKERGYELYPTNWDYDSKTQITNQTSMGKSSPTTYSQVGSTGLLGTDGDEGADDTGTD